jgi:hypothetical protein
MKIAFFVALFLSLSAFAAPQFWNSPLEGQYSVQKSFQSFDESINFQPGLDLYSEAATLTDLFGTNGSQLCAPNALTHLTNFLKFERTSNFPNLNSVPDVDNDGTADTYRDQIRYFFNLCDTHRENGTFYQSALECMRTHIVSSGYTPWAYMVGAHSTDGTQTTVTPEVLRYYLANQVGVVMMVGWYKLNENNVWERTGGHFFNLYGYDYNVDWGAEKIILKSVNSWINYGGREPSRMFDNIVMAKFDSKVTFVEYEVKGPGFDHTSYKALVDDILIILPQ